MAAEPAEGAPAALGNADGVSAVPAKDSIDAPAGTQRAASSSPQAMGEALPIDVSPGFEYLSKPASEMTDTDAMWSQWRRHQKLQSEPREESWAPRMEAALRGGIQDSLTARGLDTQRIELPVVECRTNGCEIQAVGYYEDIKKPGVDLQLILPSLLTGSLGNEFDGYSLMMSSRPDGRTTFLAQLPRKKP
jgi:hypothetical protein